MKHIFLTFIIFIVLVTISPVANAFSVSGRVSPAAYMMNGRSRYVGNNMYANRYTNQNRYIYSQQQARYNGYRTGIQGMGYNNTYYYNRYRR